MVIASGTCVGLSSNFKPLIDQGLTGQNTFWVQYLKDVNDEEFKNDDFVKLYHATAKGQGLDDTNGQYATGWVFAWYLTEIVKEAATSNGGINRANLMLAARAINKPMPLVLSTVTNKMDGVKDGYLNEAGRIVRYIVKDPTKLGTAFPQGDVINREGQLQTFKKSLEA